MLGVVWVQPEGDWYTYSRDPGSLGRPTRLSAECAGNELKIYYPPGTEKETELIPEEKVSVYPGRFPLFVRLPADADCTKAKGTLELLLCSDKRCRPVKRDIALDPPSQSGLKPAEGKSWWGLWQTASGAESRHLDREGAEKIRSEGTVASAGDYPNFDPVPFSPGTEVKNLGKAVLLALIAGLLLNFMPCVLPMISLKLRGMMPSRHAAGLRAQKKEFRQHNLFFALGMLFYFLILAGIVSYTGMAWGKIFQNSWAIVILSSIVFALSLSLFGIFDLPLIDFKVRPKGVKNPALSALFTGFLATLLATPCSGPFLGGVLAWGMIQPPAIIAAVLLSIGAGMASPYLGMALFPGLVRFMPRPGKWTRHLENGLGFVLLATSVYLLGLLPEDLIISTLVLFLSIGLAAWIWGSVSGPKGTRLKKSMTAGLGVLIITISAFTLFTGSGPGAKKVWQEFNKTDFLAQLGNNTVVVDFTADWCPNCKYLERTVLKNKNIAPLQKKHGIKFFKVDLTRKNPDGEALLTDMDSQSIPLLAIFPKQNAQEAIILRDIFTKNEFKNALDSARANEGNAALD
ncbi:MAG: cytochrome c biogenesis protein CcdA [Desulfonatronovibrionaceae bacterium]